MIQNSSIGEFGGVGSHRAVKGDRIHRVQVSDECSKTAVSDFQRLKNELCIWVVQPSADL